MRVSWISDLYEGIMNNRQRMWCAATSTVRIRKKKCSQRDSNPQPSACRGWSLPGGAVISVVYGGTASVRGPGKNGLGGPNISVVWQLWCKIEENPMSHSLEGFSHKTHESLMGLIYVTYPMSDSWDLFTSFLSNVNSPRVVQVV